MSLKRLLTVLVSLGVVVGLVGAAGPAVATTTPSHVEGVLPDPDAVGYMIRNISFTGRLHRPMLTIHTTGDPLVPVQVQHAYADAVDDAGRSALLRQAFVHRGGHCTFTTGEMLAALRVLERRVAAGRWPDTRPAARNRLASELDPGTTPAYLDYRPAPYPRPFNLGG